MLSINRPIKWNELATITDDFYSALGNSEMRLILEEENWNDTNAKNIRRRHNKIPKLFTSIYYYDLNNYNV